MPYIYRCTLHLLEPTFFSSREISDRYQTEPFIGHIALCYALGLAPSRYTNDGKTIHYRADLAALNEQGIYVTPATLTNPVYFTLGQFNAQPDGYWSAMGNNTLVTVPDGMWAEQVGKTWYVTDGVTRKKVRAENRPQFGRIRALSIGNRAEFFVISNTARSFPGYIRLGKWMSKARLLTTLEDSVDEQQGGIVTRLLALADMPPDTRLLAFDMLNVAPTPLARNCLVDGLCYRLDRHTLLPQGLRFNLEGFA
jgi:CRISPR-associated protein Csc1